MKHRLSKNLLTYLYEESPKRVDGPFLLALIVCFDRRRLSGCYSFNKNILFKEFLQIFEGYHCNFNFVFERRCFLFISCICERCIKLKKRNTIVYSNEKKR